MNGISIEEFCASHTSLRTLFDSGAVDRLANFKMCEPTLYYGAAVLAFGVVAVGILLLLRKRKK